jgi:hypothetical protein
VVKQIILQFLNKPVAKDVITDGYFCSAMKKIALLLFIVFASAELAPAVMAVLTTTISFFIADEEKSEERESTNDNQEKKDYSAISSDSDRLSNKVNTTIQMAETIHPSPCLEKPAPPPNFC